MNLRDEMTIPDWLGLLVLLCNPQETEQATANMAPMIPFLTSYPPHAFCRASARYVEAQERRRAVPSLGEIEGPLGGWIDKNPPTPEQRVVIVARLNADTARRLRSEVGQ